MFVGKLGCCRLAPLTAHTRHRTYTVNWASRPPSRPYAVISTPLPHLKHPYPQYPPHSPHTHHRTHAQQPPLRHLYETPVLAMHQHHAHMHHHVARSPLVAASTSVTHTLVDRASRVLVARSTSTCTNDSDPGCTKPTQVPAAAIAVAAMYDRPVIIAVDVLI